MQNEVFNAPHASQQDVSRLWASRPGAIAIFKPLERCHLQSMETICLKPQSLINLANTQAMGLGLQDLPVLKGEWEAKYSDDCRL